jgi:hypothetical protein
MRRNFMAADVFQVFGHLFYATLGVTPLLQQPEGFRVKAPRVPP